MACRESGRLDNIQIGMEGGRVCVCVVERRARGVAAAAATAPLPGSHYGGRWAAVLAAPQQRHPTTDT